MIKRKLVVMALAILTASQSASAQEPQFPNTVEGALAWLGTLDSGKFGEWGAEDVAETTTLNLDYQSRKKLVNENLEKLTHFRALEELHLNNLDTNSEHLKPIGKLSNLKRLNLHATEIDDDGLAHLAELKLTYLRISATNVKGPGFAHLAEMVTLEELILEYLKDLQDDGLAHLGKLINLTRLDVSETRLAGATIGSFPSLVYLKARSTPLTDEALGRSMATLPKLEELDLGRSKQLTGAFLAKARPDNRIRVLNFDDSEGLSNVGKNLGKLPMLEVLDFSSYEGVTNEAFTALGENLGKLPMLEVLDFTHCGGVTDEAMKDIGKANKLRVLDLFATSVGDGTLEALANLDALESVSLIGTRATDEGILAFREKQPGCEVKSSKRMLLVESFAAEKAFFNEHAPAGKFLGSERELVAFWRLFSIKAKKPTVDFSKELILLTTRDDNDPNRMGQALYLDDGDLRLDLGYSTMVGFSPSPNYRVRLLTTSRAGVEKVAGVTVDRNPWPKIEDWDQPGDDVGGEVDQPAPREPTSPLQKLAFDYYEGNQKALLDLNRMTPLKSDVLTDNLLTSEIRERNEGYGIRFTGTIVVPQDGKYTFMPGPGSQSRLTIAGDAVISGDGGSATVRLPRGEHAFSFDYLNPTGQSKLALLWRGPGIDGEQRLVGPQRTTEVEVLASNKTIAVFTGISFDGWANGASFEIQSYLDYQKRSGCGHGKQTELSIAVSDSHGNPFPQLDALYGGAVSLATPGQVAVINSLKVGDMVLLGWNHEYRRASWGGGPNYPVTLLRKISKDEVTALNKELEKRNQAVALAKKSGEYYQPAVFAERLMTRYPKRFGKLVPEEFEGVTELNFEDFHVDEDDLISIGKLVFLESLSLDGCKMAGEHMKHLRDLQELRVLNLKGALSDSPDAALAHVGMLKNVRELNLQWARLTDDGFTHLSKLKELRRLEFCSTPVTDKGLAALAECTKLEYLVLESTFRLKGSGFATLSKLENLRFLSLKGGDFSEELLPNLAKLTGLAELNLWAAKGFSAKNIDALASLKDLEKLNLRRPHHGHDPFAEEDVRSLKAALPECKISVGKRW